MSKTDEFKRTLTDTLTSKDADIVWACAFAMLGGVTIFNALKEKTEITLVFTLSGISLISLVPFFILRASPKRTGDILTLIVGFASFLSPMFLVAGARFSEVVYSNIYICLFLYIPGLTLYYTSLIFLGPNFGILPAVRGVSKSGPYAVIRHPMYLGEILEVTGITSAFISILTMVILVCIIILLLIRITLEERLLSENEEYRAYMLKTRYRLLPKVW